MPRHEKTSIARLRPLGSTSEFGAVLIVLFLVILFPLMNLVALAAGAATLQLASNDSASHAGVSLNYGDALNAAANSCLRLQRSGFGKFTKMTPVGGVADTGVHLFIVRTDYSSSQVQYCGPDSPAVRPIDTSGYVYEYMTIVHCNVGPFVNLSFVPFLGDVPGLGKPALLSFTSHSAVENPLGIASEGVLDDGTLNMGGIGDGGGQSAPPPDWNNVRAGEVHVSPAAPKTFGSALELPSPW